MSHTNSNTFYPAPARTNAGLVASQSITVSTSAVSVGTAFANTVDFVAFNVQGVAVRYRADGVNPTSTVGHYLAAGTHWVWSRAKFNTAVFIRDTAAASDATIFASPEQV